MWLKINYPNEHKIELKWFSREGWWTLVDVLIYVTGVIRILLIDYILYISW